jgi:5-methylcytosine-specific restriction endonuclease McrA
MSKIAFENRRVLQLNKTWTPMHTITLEKALHMVFNERARIVEPNEYQAMTWEDWSKLKPLGDDGIRAANMIFRIPEVIVLNEYDKLPQPRKTFSRRTLYKRDHYRCQYCGCQPGSHELTIDHVLPRAQGGGTTWENCVLACIECNSKKANRTPAQAGMTLLSKPAPPSYKTLKVETMKIDSWSKFLGEAYWSVPLID